MTVDHRNNSKLIWIIAGVCMALISLSTLYFWMTSRSDVIEQSSKTPSSTQMAPKQPSARAQNNQQVVDHAVVSEPTQTTIVDHHILKDQVPKNASLAKEELAKLDDIQHQLSQQKENLASQHIDADRLIQLKEEQIKLLEQQLETQRK